MLDRWYSALALYGYLVPTVCSMHHMQFAYCSTTTGVVVEVPFWGGVATPRMRSPTYRSPTYRSPLNMS